MDYFISDLHWLWMFWMVIAVAFTAIGIFKLVDEIRFQLARRRQRRHYRM